jgi:3-methyladenine DNA glycosylase AlkD
VATEKRAGSPARAPAAAEVVTELKRLGTKSTRDGMARYGIVAPKAFGVPVGAIQKLAKRLGQNHELAAALWETGWYEARMLCAYVDEPERVTPAQMDRWCRDFDNWGIVDTVCFALFDRTPHAWGKARQWAGSPREFVKRAGFVLMACLALHDKTAPDKNFVLFLSLIKKGASDERNFVKKGVSWALRTIGRRNHNLHTAAVKLAQRLAASSHPTERWLGKEALRELTSPAVIRRLGKK